MAGVIDLATYAYHLELNDKNFTSGMEKAKDSTSKFKQGMGGLSKFLKVSVLGVIGAVTAAGAGLYKIASDTAELGDKFDKMSQRTQMSTDRLQELDFIASQSGTSIETLETTMTRLTKSMSDAQQGSKKQEEAFKKLGISVVDSNGEIRDSSLVWEEVIGKFQSMDNETERNALAMDLLGKSAIDMGAMLNTSSEDMQNLSDKAHDMGMVMSEDAIASSVEFQDNMDALKRSLGGVFNTLGAEVLPAFNLFASWIQDHMPQIQAVIQTVFSAIGSVLSFFKENVFVPFIQLLEESNVGLEDSINKVLEFIKEVCIFLTSIIKSLVQFIIEWVKDNEEQLNKIKESFNAAFSKIIEYIKVYMACVQKFWQEHGDTIMSIVKILLDTVMKVINTALSLISKIFDTFSALLEGDWGRVWTNMRDMIVTILDFIVGVVRNAINLILALFGTDLKTIIGTVTDIFTNIQNVISGIIDGIIGTVRGMIDWIGKAIDKINIFNHKKTKTDTNDLPSYDVGTPFVPNDQLAFIHKGEAIVPADYNPFNGKSNASFGTTNSVSVNVVLDGAKFSSRDDVDYMMEEMQFKFEQSMREVGIRG